MNKFIILLLAVCLVSVHAFVKRDAPENPQPDIIENIKKSFDENWKIITEKVNSETIKKGFNDAIDTVNKAFDNLKPTEPPKA